MLEKVAALHLPAASRHTLSATADLQCSYTMLMRNPRPLLYLEGSHSLQSFSYLGKGGMYKIREKSKVRHTLAQRLFKNLT